MRRYVLLAFLLLPALLPSGAGRLDAAATQVWIFPSVKYVAQSSPAFSVDIRAENVSTPEMHVLYAETNVDTELRLGADPAVRATYAQSNVNTDLSIGDVAANEARGQGFRVTAAGRVNRVLLWVKKVGSPVDGLKVELRTDSGGLPDSSPGGLLSASTVASGEEDVTTSYALVLFTVLSPPTLSTGTQYHLVVKRTSPLGPDPANYFAWGADNSPAYADGAASLYNGSAWAAASPAADHAFKVETAVTARAQGFRVPTSSLVNRVLLWAKRVGAATAGEDGFLAVEIRGDSGGVPGSIIATSTAMDVAYVDTSYEWVSFTLPSSPQLSAGTQYHLVLTWTDVPDDPNYVVWGADTSSPGYGNGVAAEGYGGSVWTAATPGADQAFEVAYACPEGGGTGPCGLGAFEIRILFDAEDFQYQSMAVGPMLTSTGRALFSCSNPAPHNPSGGIVTYKCNTSGATPLGPQGSGVLATASFTALGSAGFVGDLDLSNTVLNDINNAPLAHTSQGNTVRVENLGSNDTDGDGCTDIEEEGDDIAKGGHRNPHDAYDFFDVAVPAKEDAVGDGYGDDLPPIGANGPRNKKVDMADVLAVLFYAFAKDGLPPNPNGADYDADKGVDTNGDTTWDIAADSVDDGLSYDRSAAPPFSGSPNGVIDMADVLAALIQFGHDCTQAP